MEFVIIATVVLVLAMCLGADFVIVPIMFIVFLSSCYWLFLVSSYTLL